MPQPFEIKEGVLIRYNQCLGTLQSEITIPECVTEIGANAFNGCKGLTEIIIPEGVRIIGKGAFLGCKGLTEIIIPSSVSGIGHEAFRDCTSLTEIIIPEGVRIIGKFALLGCTALQRVTLPSTLKKISLGLFISCLSLDGIIIPSGVLEIGYEAFANCISLAAITIPAGFTKIARHAFINCKALQSVTLPSTLVEIGEGVFSHCTGLTEIIIPNSVTDIQQDAFLRCSRDLKIIVSDDNIKKYTIMPACVGNDIVTFSDKLRDDSFTQEKINAINEMPFDDRVHFLGCNKEARDKLITFSQGGGDRSWVATSLGSDKIVEINAIQSTEPCAMLVELMKQYESLTGTPMRNICPQIKPTSYKEKDDDAMGDHLPNYVALAINDLVAIQAAANESAAITIQSFFKINHKRKNKIVKDKTEDCCAKPPQVKQAE